MNAIALCHNRDLQKTNGRIIVLGSGSISLMQTATWVNMQPYSQSEWFYLHFDYVMVCLSVCLSVCSMWLSPSLCAHFLHSCRSIHSSTHLPLSSCHAQINLFTRPTRSAKWLNGFRLFCLFPKQAAKPAVFFSIQHAFQRWGPCFVVCWL